MRLLLLAGTPEAVQIGHALARDRRIQATASMARASRAPFGMILPMRIGGWGSAEAFSDWLGVHRIDAVLDATHPFATGITRRSAEVCAARGVPFVQFLRPPWLPRGGDTWVFLNSERDAPQHVADGEPVFLATGRHGLMEFMGFGDRPIYVRVRDRGTDTFPFPQGGFVHRPARLPVAAEVAGLRAYGVTWMVARNTGGAWTMPVIEAARQLQIPVGMIRRPLQPEVARVQTIAEALNWVRRRI